MSEIQIRATLSEEFHRKLKAEAASEGKHLKELIEQVLVEHVKKMQYKKNSSKS